MILSEKGINKMREEFKRELLEEVYKLGFRFLATNVDGNDCVFKVKPERDEGRWLDKARTGMYFPFSLGLTSWDDTEPKRIAELLGVNEVDWFKIPVDTKILVSIDGNLWDNRHFAKYEGGKVYAWNDGLTSWTAEDVVEWPYAKLVEEPKQEKEPTINLDGVEKGTLVKVSSDGKQWYVRPFEGVKKKNVVTKEGKTIKKWTHGKFLDNKDLAFYS